MSIPFEADAQQAREPARTQAAPLRYTLTFPAPHTHYVEVEAHVPTDRHPVVELDMAVWTPGSYLVREYARNVEQVTAEGGGKTLARHEDAEEPLAHRDRRSGRRSSCATASTAAR